MASRASSPHVRARRLAASAPPEIVHDPDLLRTYLDDASSGEPGRAAGLARPVDEGEAAALLRATLAPPLAVLPQAARSSLTGGAVPAGELVVSVERLDRIGEPAGSGATARVRAGAGVRLDRLGGELARRGWYYPPVPTYEQAMVGGVVSTNAGGAATFKYGTTRRWVHGLRVLLWNGDLLELERGEATAERGEAFVVELSDGSRLEVPTPVHRLPALKKISAGYYAADRLDLVDLFIGAEGTLGLVTEAMLDLVPLPAGVVAGFAPLEDRGAALALAADLRASQPGLRSIEVADGHGLALVVEAGVAARLRVRIPDGTGAALWFEIEVHEAWNGDDAAVASLAARLSAYVDPARVDLALPADAARRASLRELREAVPRQVNERLSARRRGDPAVRKVAADPIVPFERLHEAWERWDDAFARRGLEHAIWGHLSDGNLHANAIARDAGEVAAAEAAVLEIGTLAIALGGGPLAEHGVGRDPLKQIMLRRFLGDRAVAAMRRTKHALDPPWRFAPGVLFPAPPGLSRRSAPSS